MSDTTTEGRLSEVERKSKQNTDDIAATYRMLDDIRATVRRADRRFDRIDHQLEAIEGRLDGQEMAFEGLAATLRQILERLPEKP